MGPSPLFETPEASWQEAACLTDVPQVARAESLFGRQKLLLQLRSPRDEGEDEEEVGNHNDVEKEERGGQAQEKDRRIGWMADIRIRAGRDQFVISGEGDVHYHVTTQVSVAPDEEGERHTEESETTELERQVARKAKIQGHAVDELRSRHCDEDRAKRN